MPFCSMDHWAGQPLRFHSDICDGAASSTRTNPNTRAVHCLPASRIHRENCCYFCCCRCCQSAAAAASLAVAPFAASTTGHGFAAVQQWSPGVKPAECTTTRRRASNSETTATGYCLLEPQQPAVVVTQCRVIERQKAPVTSDQCHFAIYPHLLWRGVLHLLRCQTVKWTEAPTVLFPMCCSDQLSSILKHAGCLWSASAPVKWWAKWSK